MLRKLMVVCCIFAAPWGCAAVPDADVHNSNATESHENVNVQPAVEDLGDLRVSPEVAAVLARRVEALPIVATTVARTGETFDWIPVDSQTPDGVIATPPPPLAASPGALTTALDDEPDKQGPPGTVPLLRPDIRKIRAPGSAANFFSKYGTAGDPGFMGEVDYASLSAGERANLKHPQTFLGLFPGITCTRAAFAT